MAKFKVGDRVRCLENYGSQFTAGKTYTVSGVTRDRISVERDDGGSTSNGWCSDRFVLAATTGPIRTVTRREIVPGVYGRVSVHDDYSVGFSTELDGRDAADELREAAHLFNQIAEVLEEQASD